jgi:hypothetical protein
MWFRLLLIASIIVLVTANAGHSGDKRTKCTEDFRKCIEDKKVTAATCRTELEQCAVDNCLCFDIAKHGFFFCKHENSTSKVLKACLKNVEDDYKTCAKKCNHSTVSEIHKAQSLTSSDIFGINLCSICTDVVGVIESNSACNVASLASKFCGAFASLCKSAITSACNALVSYLKNNPKTTPQSACAYIHLCSSSSAASNAVSSVSSVSASGSSDGHVVQQSLVTVPDLSPSGASDFIGTVDDSADVSCTLTSSNPETYTCQAATSLNAPLPASSAASDNSSGSGSGSSSSSSGLDSGAIAAIIMGVALAIVLAAFFVYARRHGTKAVGVDGGYTNMTENRL